MRRGDDVTLARRLAEALDGRAQATGELEAIVRVLEAAAADARFGVAADETERALAAARPRPRPARRRWPLAAAAAAVAVVAAALVLVSPLRSPSTVDVQAQALAALGGPGSVLEVVERITPGPGGGFAASTRTGWIDPARNRALWTQSTAAGTAVDQTLVERGRVTRYDPATHSAVVAASCTALATGCASAVDPIAVYRAALLRVASTSARTVTVHGRSAYRFSLPVTRLADATRVAQVVTIDARTLLPQRIVWQAGGKRTIAVIDVRSATVMGRDRAPSDAFSLALPPGTAITQLAASGQPVRLLAAGRISVAQARALRPPPYWLGRRDGRFPLGQVTRYRYTGGDALMLRYGSLRVWSYGRVVPPALLANLAVPVKQFPVGARTARLYATAGGMFAVEVDRPGGTVVVIAPAILSSAAINALARLRPLAAAG
ncbi:MAG TPA: hypothetical protein VGI72_06435 [Gaiellales bacterium]